MLTRSQLRNYDTERLKNSSSEADKASEDLLSRLDEIREQRTKLISAWLDPKSALAQALIDASMEATKAEADDIKAMGPVLTGCADTIDGCKKELETADATGRDNPCIVADDRGQVSITRALANLPENKWPEQYEKRTNLQHSYFQILDKATKADEEAALALYKIRQISPPFAPRPDTGPVDLSDEALADQAANSEQGKNGDCFFLSSVAAIASTDPEFIRKNVVWDPETGTYKVTIYENAVLGTIKREITVDPKEISDDPDRVRGPNGELNVLSIYEAAYKKSALGSVFSQTGGVPSSAMLAITGHMADFTLLKPHSFDEIRQGLSAQPPQAVAVGTNAGAPWDVNPAEQPFDKRIVPRHSYWVKGFDGQGRIILVNTWGPGGGTSGGVEYPGEVHLTEEEFRKVVMQSSRTAP